MAEARRQLATGEIVAGRFELDRLVRTGGMGSVFRALDRMTGAPVAVKVLSTSSSSDDERFEQEARILAELVHPGIVRYVAHGVMVSGERYLVMEWLDGEDLGQRLAYRALGVADSVLLARRVATALGEAHRRAIVHRDIKPSNLFLAGARIQDVKILDFGIARLERRGAPPTQTGTTIGTPGYMAPEQARGDRIVDARADVFALGCVLFECLCGRPAFLGEHPLAVLAKIVLEDPPRLSELAIEAPPALEALLARMLAKDRGERPSDGHAVAAELLALDAAVEGAVPLSERPRLTRGEQRWLSAVFARSLRAREMPDPSTAPTLSHDDVTGAFRALDSAVDVFGARLAALADGSVIATLAGTGAVTDQALRAARCALALRRLLPDSPMVIASGRGQLADRFPIGAVIDRAVRLLRDAPSRSEETATLPIRVDETTAGLIGGRFELTGDADGLCLTESETEDGVRTLLGRPTPCVGRDSELGLLEAMFEECCGEPRVHAVLISGPPGAGKSRLRAEFLERARARRPDLEIWIGRGDPIAGGSPFGVLAPALRRAFGLRDGEPVLASRRKIAARVGQNVPEPDRARVTEFLGELLGVPFADENSVQLKVARSDATLMGDQMRRAFEELLAAESTAKPILIVLEDLHWGDLPSVSFVDSAARLLVDRPLMVLGLARPEVYEAFPQLWQERDLQTIRLGRLSSKAGEKLVRAVLGADASPELVARLVERAGGNAFHLEEVIRAVVEGRGAELPETVLATAEARIATLDPEARRVLRAASVFGKVFWRGGVAALIDGQGTSSDRDEWLRVLNERELIERRSPPKFAGEHEYAFRHALLRDAAYAMLTDDDRRLGHRLAADWLERAGESDAVVLAEHFVRGAEPVRAVGWFERGAAQALEGHDFLAAVARAERGIACGAGGAQRGALRLAEAEARRWRGDFAEAQRAAVDAAELIPSGRTSWYRAVDEILIASGRLARFDTAADWAERAISAAPAEDAASARVICLSSASRVLFHAGRYDLAEKLLGRVSVMLADRRSAVDPRARAEVERLCGARARHVGDLVGDVRGYRAALEAFEQAGDARNACNARVSLGFAYAEVGDHERAAAELERALSDAGRMGLSTVATRARQNLGLVRGARGETEQAIALLEQAIEESRAQGNVRFEGWTRVYLSNARYAAGDAKRAEDEAREAAELFSMTPPARAGALAARARALVAIGRVEDALDAATSAAEILRAFGGIEEFESLVRVALIEALRASGDVPRAAQVAAEAHERLLARANSIDDVAWRGSFLRQVTENARILELSAVLTPKTPEPQ
jgi:eukaryotic-like serine/threonine-protein kinase